MTNNIIHFDEYTLRDLHAPDILRAIAENKPKHVFVIAWGEDGDNPTYHCSMADTPVVLLRLQQFIHGYFNGDFG